MPERAVVVHYHEVGLKGRNRTAFENVLKRNLEHAAGELLGERRARRIPSRLLVPVADAGAAARDVLLERLRLVPGVSYLGDALVTGRDIPSLEAASLRVLGEVPDYGTFRVEARRSATEYPMTSQEVNVEVGRFLVEHTGKKVDLGDPEATAFIEMVQGVAYVYARRVPGVGGLPVGTSGRVVALLSAGIDSPVAAWRLMKRGAVVVGVHFSGVPHTNDASMRLAYRIGERLERYGGMARIWVVPFGDIQREVSLTAPPHLRVLLYRRLMVRIAEEVARREGAKALATGESLGQVASQTLENVAAVDAAAATPVLRPLIGMDKLEIIEQAREIGTYDISTQCHDDCCTLFMPRRPATHATVGEVDAAEAGLDVEALVARGLEGMTARDFSSPAYHPRSGTGPTRSST